MMKDQDYELLSQYLDGELESEAHTALETRLRADAELRSTLDRMQGIDAAIRSAYKGSHEAPIQVAAMLEPADAKIVAFPRQRRTAAWQYAVAASLVAAAGLLLSPEWNQQGAPAGDLMLSAVLEQSPSRASGWETLEDGRQVRPVLSFPLENGNWCREYLLREAGTDYRGVACRGEDAQWQAQVVAQVDLPGASTDYRPAGAGDSDRIAEFIDQRGADIPLSANREAELIEHGWQ